MRVWNLLVIMGFVLLSVCGGSAQAEETAQALPTEEAPPREVLEKADEARGSTEGVEWKVSIHSIENGREDDLDFDVKAKGFNYIAIATAPPKMKGQKVLMNDRNMWFTKPGLKKPVPVSPKQKLLGAAAYGDIAATNYAEEYEATRLEDETMDGRLCYAYDLKAVDKKSTYDRIKYWVSKDDLVGVKAEYYTVSNKLLKTAVFEYANEVMLRGNPRPFISKMTITDALMNANVTTLSFSEPKLVAVPDSAFDLNLLMLR